MQPPSDDNAPAQHTLDLDNLQARRLTIADLIILEAIGVRLVVPATGAPVDLSFTGIISLIFMMTTESPGIIDVFNKQGAQEIQCRINEFSGRIPADQLAALVARFDVEMRKMFGAAVKV
jgi:hypothetical protein